MNHNTNTSNEARDLVELLKGQHFVMFTTRAADGSLVSRPMTVQEVEGAIVRFIAQDDNDVTREAEGCAVNLAVMDGGTYISLSGTTRVERDLALKKELWNRLNEAYAGEPEDPNNIVLEVTVTDGHYWDAGNPVARLLGLAKAAVTGEPPAGEHGPAQV